MSGIGIDSKRSGYLKRINSPRDAASAKQDDNKRTRFQSSAITTTTTTTTPQKNVLEMIFKMEYIDKHTQRIKKETLGPLPFVDLVKAFNKKLIQLQKDYPYSEGVKRLLSGFSDAKIQPLVTAINNPIYCLPLSSLPKSNELEPCLLNNGQHAVLARISDKNEIVFFLRMHPIKDNYKLFMETPILVPKWLENDVREAMTSLIANDDGMLRHYDRNVPRDAYINNVKTSIATGTFGTAYPNIKYLHQFQCPTIYVCFQAPTPKIVEVSSPDIGGLFAGLPLFNDLPTSSPDLLDDLFNFPTPTSLAFPSSFDDDLSLDNNFLNWPDFELSSPMLEAAPQTTQAAKPLIFTQQSSSNNNITRPVTRQSYRY